MLCRSPRCLPALFNWEITHLRCSQHPEFINCNPFISVCQETNHVSLRERKKNERENICVKKTEEILVCLVCFSRKYLKLSRLNVITFKNAQANILGKQIWILRHHVRGF